MKILSGGLLAGIAALVLFLGPAWPAEIHEAAKAGDLAKVQALIGKDPALVNARDETGRTPLHWACRGVHVEILRALVGQGADVNAQDGNGVSPLHSVSSRGHVEAAKLLLDRGARPEAKMYDSSTALHLAAANGHTEVVVLLVERGAPLYVQDDREDTPLHAAAQLGKWEVVGLLADRAGAGQRAALDRPDFDGSTVLHLAAGSGQLATVKLLLARGVDISARNTLGQSAYNLAEEGGLKEIAALLADKGADRGPQRFPRLGGPYLGQTPPGTTPRLFAKGIVSTRRGLYGTIVFSPDGREAFWKPEGPRMLGMKQDRDVWGPPREFAFTGKKTLNVPFFSHDGRKLYFMVDVSRNAQGIIEKEAIWFTEKTGAGWSEPKSFDPVVNSAEMHWQFSMDKRGHLYLNSDGGINCARRKSGRYLPPTPLPAPINEKHTEDQRYRAGELGPFISPSGDYLIYTKMNADALWPSQLFISFRNKDGIWSEPWNLSGKLQTEGNDSMAKVTSDGKYLFFQSVRRGSGASRGLYWVDARIIEELRSPKK